MEEIKTSTLIRIQNHPVIDYRGIEGISEMVDKRISALQLDKQVANEDTVKVLKAMRARLNKEFNDYEEQRKAVKAAISNPYTEFENKYKELIASKFKDADEKLRVKIYSVEDELKRQKTEKMEAYFNEYAQTKEIDFVTFSRMNLNITLSASEKSIKDQIDTFLDDIRKDLDTISIIPEDEEFRAEVLIDYKKTLDAISSITAVTDRKKKKEQLIKQSETTQQPAAQTPISDNEPLKAPVVEETPTSYTASFTVTATIEQLKTLKQFLTTNNIKFKNI